MSAFRYTDYNQGAGQLAQDNTKETSSASTSFQLEHTLTLTPAPDEYHVVTSVSESIAADTTIPRTVTAGYSTQIEGGSESSIATIDSHDQGSAALNCTNDVFTGVSLTLSPSFRGELGKDTTVRFYQRVNDVTGTTDMCSRSATVNGRTYQRESHTYRGAFKGAF